jgi:hypothetical protein
MNRNQPVVKTLHLPGPAAIGRELVSSIAAEIPSGYLSSVLRTSLVSGVIILIIDLLIGIL